MSRQATAYVSQYQPREVELSMILTEKRAISANFTGASSSTISSVTWQTKWGGDAFVTLAAGSHTDTIANASLTANVVGFARFQCNATFADGSIIVQRFVVNISGLPA
jgi:hypothetical protein